MKVKGRIILISLIASLMVFFYFCAPDNNKSSPENPISCIDQDNDGYGENCSLGTDCDDSDPDNWISCLTCLDTDQDGYFANCDAYNYHLGPDCDDSSSTIHPQASEICGDSVDQDCDGADIACNCGDGNCAPGEDVNSCPQDCPGTCGDQICNTSFGEDVNNCEQDCHQCGDSICSDNWESVSTCPQDCPGTCGDQICNTNWESVSTCPQDCPGYCGDGICNIYYEDTSCSDCSEDNYEENDSQANAFIIDSDVYGLSPITGCLSDYNGLGVSLDNDWYGFVARGMVTSGDIWLVSSDTSGELDLCYTVIGNIMGNTIDQGCSAQPGNNDSINNINFDYGDGAGEEFYVQVILTSGNGVVYDLCWSFETSCGNQYCEPGLYFEDEVICPWDCACECGDGYCSDTDTLFCYESLPGDFYYCPEDCGCDNSFCGDWLCDYYCGEDTNNCPDDCP